MSVFLIHYRPAFQSLTYETACNIGSHVRSETTSLLSIVSGKGARYVRKWPLYNIHTYVQLSLVLSSQRSTNRLLYMHGILN